MRMVRWMGVVVRGGDEEGMGGWMGLMYDMLMFFSDVVVTNVRYKIF